MNDTPTKPGFYWAQWRIADEGTQDDGNLPAIGTWEVVDVFENCIDRNDPEHLAVHVSGVSKGQSIENFVWGEGPLKRGPDTEDRMLAFKNRLRSLFNIDGFLLPELSRDQQYEFVRDPVRYLIRTDRAQSEAIWREVERRQRKP